MAPVTIIGAGIGGLTLGQCLKHKGIPTIIYDRASSPRHHSYGIVLRPSSYRPLLRMLRMDEATFRRRTAADGQHRKGAGASASSESFRCHRGRFEDLLRQDLTIIQGKQLKKLTLDSRTRGVDAIFDDGAELSAQCLIGCDGPHSTARRSVSPELDLQVLPYVVFHGKRQVSLDDFEQSIRSHLGGKASVSTVVGNVRLEISLEEILEFNVTIGYTYSRPSGGSNDALHKPTRSNAEATDTPDAFFKELTELPQLQPPFDEIFRAKVAQEDRLLHWLMRIVPPELAELNRLAKSGVVLIGDAAHATPILGGEGANIAIQDSMELAEHIASRGTKDFKAYTISRFDTWKKAVDDSERRIAEMHTSQRARI